MPQTETLSVALPAEIIAEVRESVEAGEYASSNELVREALQEWSVRRHLEIADVAALRNALEEVDSPDTVYLPMDEVFDRLEAKYKALAQEASLTK